MGRTKGSKNKAKKTMKVENSAKPSTETPNVSQEPNQEATTPEVETTTEVAPEPVATVDPEPEFQHPTVMPDDVLRRGRGLLAIAHEWAEEEQSLQNKRSEKELVMKDYSKAIGVLEARCGELAQEYREAERPISYDQKHGWKYFWDGATGELIRKEKLGPGTVPLPGIDAPAEEEAPKKKRSKKAKEEKPGGPSFPLEVGTRVFWPGSRLKGRITAADDAGYLVEYDASENGAQEEPAKLQAIDFAEAVEIKEAELENPGAVVVPGTIEVGTHYRLADEELPENLRLLTVTEAEGDVIQVRWAHSGLGGSVPRSQFAFAQIATQAEVDAAKAEAAE